MKANRRKLELAMAKACMNTSDLQKAAGMPRPTVNSVIGAEVADLAQLDVLQKLWA